MKRANTQNDIYAIPNKKQQEMFELQEKAFNNDKELEEFCIKMEIDKLKEVLL